MNMFVLIIKFSTFSLKHATISAREELRAEEFTKFQAALMWSKKYCDSNPNTQLKEIMGTFLANIFFHKIPANVLMREIYPLNVVPYNIIMNA